LSKDFGKALSSIYGVDGFDFFFCLESASGASWDFFLLDDFLAVAYPLSGV
jgi:hypothetical protein